MSSVSSSVSLNSQFVLPPIVVNEKDRLFLQGINDWINAELSRVNQIDPEQRFIVHRQAFDKVRLA